MQTTALLAALGSALGFALATSLQHHAAGAAPHTVHGALGLLRHLLGRPRWLAGQILSFASFCLHALALHLGALALVQPVVVSGIVLAVPIRAALTRHRPPASELGSVLLAATGLAAFLVSAGPMPGDGRAAVPAAAVFAVAGALLALALHRTAGQVRTVPVRAGLYGVVGGVLFGLVAGLVKLSLQRLSEGGAVALLTGWPLWTLIVLGMSGVAVNQQAYRVGSLSASMPILNVANVVVAITFGVVVFDEVPSHTPGALAVQALALGCIAAGLVGLGRHADTETAEPDAPVHRVAD